MTDSQYNHQFIAGLSTELFGDDPEGLMGSILFQEGEVWHHSRKLISHSFNLADVRQQHFEILNPIFI